MSYAPDTISKAKMKKVNNIKQRENAIVSLVVNVSVRVFI